MWDFRHAAPDYRFDHNGPMIDDDTHDRMFLVILPRGETAAPVDRAQTVELSYGD